MLRDFIKHSSTYWLVSLFSKLINLLSLTIYVRILKPEEIGVYEMITALTLILGGFVALELTQAVGRFLKEKNKKVNELNYVSTAFWFTFFSLSITTILLIRFSESVSLSLFDSIENSQAIEWGAISFWAIGLSGFALNLLRWDFKNKSYAFITFLQTLITQLASIVFIYFFNQGINGLFMGVTIGSLLSFIVAFFISKKFYKIYFNFNTCIFMLSFSAPLALSGLASISMSQVDRFIINHILTIREVGEYSVAFRFSSIVSFLLVGFNSALTPLITKNWHDPNASIHMATIFKYFITLALILVFLITIFSNEYLSFFAGSSYHEATYILPLLAFASLISGMYIFAPGLWLANKTLLTLFINIISLLFGIILTYFLVKHYGLLGAASSTIINAFFQFSLLYYFGQKEFHISNNWIRISLALFVFIFLIIFFQIYFNDFMLDVFQKLMFFIIGSLIIIIPIVNSSDLRSLLNVIKKNG